MSPPEHRHDLDVGRPDELVDGCDGFEAVTAIRQDARVAGEGAGIAGYGNDLRYAALRQHLALRLRPGARRIEDHAVVVLQLVRLQWVAGEIAPFRRDAAEAVAAGRTGQRRQ